MIIIKAKSNKLIKLSIIITCSILICLLLIFLEKNFYIFTNVSNFKKFVLSFGSFGMIIFVLFQIIQVVIFFIPGEIMQMAGGYAYGTLLGGILSLIGITLGSIIVFFISKKYGKPFVEKVVSKHNIDKFQNKLNNKRRNLIVFVLYLLPGMPKDSLVFICGISNISFKNFVIFSTLGRIPYLFLSCYFAANVFTGNKTVLLSIVSIMTILFIVVISKGQSFLNKQE